MENDQASINSGNMGNLYKLILLVVIAVTTSISAYSSITEMRARAQTREAVVAELERMSTINDMGADLLVEFDEVVYSDQVSNINQQMFVVQKYNLLMQEILVQQNTSIANLLAAIYASE